MNFIAPPIFRDDPEKTRQAQLLHIVSSLLFFIFLALIAVNLVLKTRFGAILNLSMGALALLQILTQFLFRRGYVKQSALLLFVLSWGSVTWLAGALDGVRSVILFAYFTIFLGVGYVFGWRIVLLFTVASTLAVWFYALRENAGVTEVVIDNPVGIALNLTALFIFSSAQIYFVLSVLRKALNEADRELLERLNVEQTLRNEQERLALALEASKMETWNWNIATGTVSWSEGVEALFGMQNGQFDGTFETYLSLIHPEDVPMLQQAIEQALTDPAYHYVVVHRLIKPDGAVCWLEGRGNVFRDTEDRPVRMAGTVVDVTARKLAEVEREQLLHELSDKNTELEQFIYMVSHDLKSPIITIRGFLGYLEQDAMAGNHERLRKDMDRIGSAVDKMHRLLNELLELSRIGRVESVPEPVPFATLVKESLEVLDGRLQGISLQIKLADDLPTVFGDRRRLLDVMQNLIDNAIKFSSGEAAPLIEIGTRGMDSEMHVIFIRDNGIGIAPQHHERIFGLFNKLDPLVDGTGVGLALVKRIIEYHSGRIWVESEAGAGATFCFTLPTPPNSITTQA